MTVIRVIVPPNRAPKKMLNRVFFKLLKTHTPRIIARSKNDRMDKICKGKCNRKKPRNNIMKSGKK